MSTHASIGILDADGGIRSVSVHFDGDRVGKTLVEHHPTRGDAEAIIALGDLRCLGEVLEFAGDPVDGHRILLGGYNTEAYARDVGDPWSDVKPQEFAASVDWIRASDFAQYRYLFMAPEGFPEGWYLYVGSPSEREASFSPLMGVVRV